MGCVGSGGGGVGKYVRLCSTIRQDRPTEWGAAYRAELTRATFCAATTGISGDVRAADARTRVRVAWVLIMFVVKLVVFGAVQDAF